ncbi:hypothetical protein H9P43_010118 [Blastocladiella emersonii ATCC 22665]|nr:hypothetical protein H9P43_010118 [Blastocladiella emersonii ATCC 22665]
MFPPLSIAADEVNYLIYRYLLESGFRHSVFAFEHESKLTGKLEEFRQLEIRPGQLIALLHKALQLMQVEIHMEDDGTERQCEATLSLLAPHSCSTPLESSSARRQRKMSELVPLAKEPGAADNGLSQSLKKKDKKSKRKDRARDSAANGDHVAGSDEARARSSSHADGDAMDVDGAAENGTADDEMTVDDVIVQVQIDDASDNGDAPTGAVITLQSTNARYYMSAWNPTDENLLASGSLNSMVGLWTVPQTNGRLSNVVMLPHDSDSSSSVPTTDGMSSSNSITALGWSPNGDLLATGTKDARVRVFTKAGDLVLTFTVPPASPSRRTPESSVNAVLELAFSADSGLLAVGSTQGTVLVWDVRNDTSKYSLACPGAAIMAFDWDGKSTLAVGSSDHLVRLIDVESGSARELRGHSGDVNVVAWDPSKQHLASCSDDGTVRIWSASRTEATAVLQGHEREVLAMAWNPRPPSGASQLATVGADKTVRIWDVATATCVYSLDRFVQTHCVLTFSPDGRYLACGSDDQYLYVWTSSAELVCTFYGYNDILDLRYNRTGDRMAVCFGTSQMAILPLGGLTGGGGGSGPVLPNGDGANGGVLTSASTEPRLRPPPADALAAAPDSDPGAWSSVASPAAAANTLPPSAVTASS